MEGSYRGFPDALCASLKHRLFRVLPALLGVVLVAPAWAADLIVPYVPTPQEVVERMLQMARVTSADYLIDLGSGDGRIVITAAKKYGTRGFGVDLNPERIGTVLRQLWRIGAPVFHSHCNVPT